MNARILDVIFLGPLQILVGLYTKNILLKIFMITTGLMNIIYNGHNFLHFQYNWKISPIFHGFVDKIQGKTQIHRLYNILIMYPIFYYVYKTEELPKILSYLFLGDIIIGFIYNLYNFIYINFN